MSIWSQASYVQDCNLNTFTLIQWFSGTLCFWLGVFSPKRRIIIWLRLLEVWVWFSWSKSRKHISQNKQWNISEWKSKVDAALWKHSSPCKWRQVWNFYCFKNAGAKKASTLKRWIIIAIPFSKKHHNILQCLSSSYFEQFYKIAFHRCEAKGAILSLEELQTYLGSNPVICTLALLPE